MRLLLPRTSGARDVVADDAVDERAEHHRGEERPEGDGMPEIDLHQADWQLRQVGNAVAARHHRVEEPRNKVLIRRVEVGGMRVVAELEDLRRGHLRVELREFRNVMRTEIEAQLDRKHQRDHKVVADEDPSKPKHSGRFKRNVHRIRFHPNNELAQRVARRRKAREIEEVEDFQRAEVFPHQSLLAEDNQMLRERNRPVPVLLAVERNVPAKCAVDLRLVKWNHPFNALPLVAVKMMVRLVRHLPFEN
jgi:hypothetical protein